MAVEFFYAVVTPATQLPVRRGVQFKLCVIMQCVHNGRAPAYLDNAVQPVNRRAVRPGLRSETHKTIMFHEFAPNLVNVHFPTQDQSFGTIYPCTSVLNQTLRVSRTFVRHTFLDSHLTY